MTTSAIIEHRSSVGTWSIAQAKPPARLGGIAVRYQDYGSVTPGCVRDTHPPSAGATIIITLGPKIGVVDAEEPGGPAEYREAFFAGLHDVPAMTESVDESRGVQIDLTPLGAFMLLRAPMDGFTRRSVSLEDAFGGDGRALIERIADTPGPEAKFAAVDAFIDRRLEHAREPSPAVVRAWHRLNETAGGIPIGRLAAEIGWSRKHLNARFQEQIGLPPKTLARVLRFRRVMRMLDTGVELPWSIIALRAGYYDQAHFNRDVRQFAGCTPGELLAGRRRLPGRLLEA